MNVFQFSKKSPGIGLSPAPDLEKVNFFLSKKFFLKRRPKNFFLNKSLKPLILQLKAEGGGTPFGYPSPGDYGKLGEAGMYGAQDYARWLGEHVS